MKVLYAMVALLIAAPVLANDHKARGPAADEVRGILNAAGYTTVRDLELDDGLWEGEVQHDDGRWYDIHVVPDSGEILDAHAGKPVLPAQEILARLEAGGYTKIRDLELEDALWEADATAPDGKRVEVRLNGFDGTVLVTEIDD